jgi:integrase
LMLRHHHMAALHCVLQIAVKWDLIRRNLADAIDLPRITRSNIRVMHEDDIHTFLEAAKPTPYYALFYLALFTGIRRSELLALR